MKACKVKNALTWVVGFLIAAIGIFYSNRLGNLISLTIMEYLDCPRDYAALLGFSIVPALILWAYVKVVKRINKNRTASYKTHEDIAKYGKQYQAEYKKRSARYRLKNKLTYIIGIPVGVGAIIFLDNSEFSRSTDESKLLIIVALVAFVFAVVLYQINSNHKEDFEKNERQIRETLEEVETGDKTES